MKVCAKLSQAKGLLFLIAAFIDRFNQVRLDICRLKYLNSECNAVNLTDQIEFMEWTHVCTTFEVWDHDEVLRELAQTIYEIKKCWEYIPSCGKITFWEINPPFFFPGGRGGERAAHGQVCRIA